MKKLQEYNRYLDSMKKVENGHWIAKSDLKEFIENDRAEQLILSGVSQQSELLLQSYKKGFEAATECLIKANNSIKEMKL